MRIVRCLRPSSCYSQSLRHLSSSSSSSSSQPPHHDIPSFLNYAYTNNLSPTSTVFSGTLYEYTVLHALSTRLPPLITLTRSGGRDDHGIDLFGLWSPLSQIHNDPSVQTSLKSNVHPPTVESSQNKDDPTSSSSSSSTTTIPLMIQCKAVVTTGPHIIRELEGALTNRSPSTMGILASTANCTPGIRRHIAISARALGFIKVTPLEYTIPKRLSTTIRKNGQVVKLTGGGGLLQQFVWNAKASEMLRDFGVTARYVPQDTTLDTDTGEVDAPEVEGEEDAGKGPDEKKVKRKRRKQASSMLEQEIALTYKGLPIPLT